MYCDCVKVREQPHVNCHYVGPGPVQLLAIAYATSEFVLREPDIAVMLAQPKFPKAVMHEVNRFENS